MSETEGELEQIKFIELFAGIGGFRYGLEKSNRQQQENSEIGGCGDSIGNQVKQPNQSEKRGNYTCDQPNDDMELRGFGQEKENPKNNSTESVIQPNIRQSSYCCVWANELDRYASAIYRYHYGNICEADIRTVDPTTIPEHDLICAGFPCQSFSIAGKRGGFEDTRGTLFFEICRIARAKGTKYLLLENVKGLLNHDKGKTFQTIIRTLDELGYGYQWQVLNSKDYGVPQNRERVFIIGHLRGQPQPKVFPIREDVEGINKGADDSTVVRTLQGGGHLGGHHSGMTLLQVGNVDNKGHNSIWGRVYDPEGLAININSEGGGLGAKTGLYQVNPNKESGGKEPYQQNRIYASKGLSPALNSQLSDMYKVEIANAVDPDGYLRSGARPRDANGKPQLLPIGYRRIRRLTPIECERLQGFLDNFTKYGLDRDGKQIEISDTQRYKTLGNAVTTNVITAIGKEFQKNVVKV